GSSMHIQPLVPARSCFILPSALISMMVASFETDAGAALMARAILPASPAPPFFGMVACPDAAFGSSLGFSWAPPVQPAMINTPVAIASAFFIVSLPGCRREVLGPDGVARGRQSGIQAVTVISTRSSGELSITSTVVRAGLLVGKYRPYSSL